MNKKTFNARFTPKGDTEANWNKAVGFVPLDKEIIIYKADVDNPAVRIKIGDGRTVVQRLPFVVDPIGLEEGIVEYISYLLDQNMLQPDYEQNDQNAKDYIKNRPCYKETKLNYYNLQVVSYTTDVNRLFIECVRDDAFEAFIRESNPTYVTIVGYDHFTYQSYEVNYRCHIYNPSSNHEGENRLVCNGFPR